MDPRSFGLLANKFMFVYNMSVEISMNKEVLFVTNSKEVQKLENINHNGPVPFVCLGLVQMCICINPFDTKPMAKIAVKMSIMRVVKFMSS